MSTQLKSHADANDLMHLTYRRIRKTIGYLGISLPIILVLLSTIPFFKTNIQPSISDYYYTNLREIFTGILCAVGLFMIRYKGYSNDNFFKSDNRMTNIAGFMAFGVALFPTSVINDHIKTNTIIPYDWSWISYLHYGCAGILFITFAILSINVFTQGQHKETQKPDSILNENNIYKFCGWGIIICIILIPVAGYFKWFYHSTLVFEAIGLLLFGISWLVKGRFIGDKGVVGEKLYNEINIQNTEKVLEQKLEEESIPLP